TLYKKMVARIQAARTAEDRATLEGIEKVLGDDEMKTLNEGQRKYLAKSVTEALSGMPKDAKAADPAAAALSKLAGASRPGGRYQSTNSYYSNTLQCSFVIQTISTASWTGPGARL